MTGYVYMTASQKRGTIYIGVTNDLGRRIPEHQSGKCEVVDKKRRGGGDRGYSRTNDR
jgi:predicted GIY-YIG superfamily endonuclease